MISDLVCLCPIAEAPISANVQATAVDPSRGFFLLPIVISLEVPHLAVVILPEPSKLVPLIVLAVVNLTALLAAPATLELPA